MSLRELPGAGQTDHADGHGRVRLDRRDPLPRRAKKYTLYGEIPTASRQPITAKVPAEFTAVTPERAKVLN